MGWTYVFFFENLQTKVFVLCFLVVKELSLFATFVIFQRVVAVYFQEVEILAYVATEI